MLNSDVYSFSDNLDETMTQADRGELLDYCELNNVPADWIFAGITVREAVKTITSIMLYFMRVAAIIGYPADPLAGVTLNTQYQNISNPLHDALYQAAMEKGYIWGSRDNDQLRKIMKEMGEQWGTKPIYLGFTEI